MGGAPADEHHTGQLLLQPFHDMCAQLFHVFSCVFLFFPTQLRSNAEGCDLRQVLCAGPHFVFLMAAHNIGQQLGSGFHALADI